MPSKNIINKSQPFPWSLYCTVRFVRYQGLLLLKIVRGLAPNFCKWPTHWKAYLCFHGLCCPLSETKAVTGYTIFEQSFSSITWWNRICSYLANLDQITICFKMSLIALLPRSYCTTVIIITAVKSVWNNLEQDGVPQPKGPVYRLTPFTDCWGRHTSKSAASTWIRRGVWVLSAEEHNETAP